LGAGDRDWPVIFAAAKRFVMKSMRRRKRLLISQKGLPSSVEDFLKEVRRTGYMVIGDRSERRKDVIRLQNEYSLVK